MSKLTKLATSSDLMMIDITYAGKRHRFNLYEELEVHEGIINKEMKTHASSYSFLLMLRTNLLRELKKLEERRKSIRSKLYSINKEKNTGGRPLNDDLCWAKAESHKKYKQAVEDCIEMEFNWSILNNAVIAFEIRKDLMQSLSANLRKER